MNSNCFVLEKNPPKQGLKLGKVDEARLIIKGFREKSTKTRIETRLERIENALQSGFREKSTKTRIET